jgi:hypothetical protein
MVIDLQTVKLKYRRAATMSSLGAGVADERRTQSDGKSKYSQCRHYPLRIVFQNL